MAGLGEPRERLPTNGRMKAVGKWMAIHIEHAHRSSPRADKAPHLAGIEQAMRIDFMLEAELIRIRALVAAAVLDGEDVRIGDEDPALLVQTYDLVEAIRIG